VVRAAVAALPGEIAVLMVTVLHTLYMAVAVTPETVEIMVVVLEVFILPIAPHLVI
jgi:hypothetical protein